MPLTTRRSEVFAMLRGLFVRNGSDGGSLKAVSYLMIPGSGSVRLFGRF
jgi:hypothetical protein